MEHFDIFYIMGHMLTMSLSYFCLVYILFVCVWEKVHTYVKSSWEDIRCLPLRRPADHRDSPVSGHVSPRLEVNCGPFCLDEC